MKVLLAGCNLGSSWRARGVPGVDEEGNLTPPVETPEPVIDEPGEYKISENIETGEKEVVTYDPDTGGNKVTTIDSEGSVTDVKYVPINAEIEAEKEIEEALITAETYDETSELIKEFAKFAPLAGLALLALLI